jgi:hypothetical protein
MSSESNAVKKQLKDKAKAVSDAANASSLRAFQTPHGEVRMATIRAVQDADGLDLIEVWIHGDTTSGDPHFRIYNPPLLASDPEGDTEVHGRRFRQDPLAAVAEVIGRYGGAVKGTVR